MLLDARKAAGDTGQDRFFFSSSVRYCFTVSALYRSGGSFSYRSEMDFTCFETKRASCAVSGEPRAFIRTRRRISGGSEPAGTASPGLQPVSKRPESTAGFNQSFAADFVPASPSCFTSRDRSSPTFDVAETISIADRVILSTASFVRLKRWPSWLIA